MFSNLGLLGQGKCPDGEGCTRIRCLFNHGTSQSRRPAPTTGASSSTGNLKKRPLDENTEASSATPSKTVKRPVDDALSVAKASKSTSVPKVRRTTIVGPDDSRYLRHPGHQLRRSLSHPKHPRQWSPKPHHPLLLDHQP
jgi:hypothetical protein